MKAKLWRLAVPIHAENRSVYETLIVGQDGVVDIDINDHGLVIIDRGPSVPRLIVHGPAWGHEMERPAAPERKTAGVPVEVLEAVERSESVVKMAPASKGLNVPLKGAKP